MNLYHYHMALKLGKKEWWLGVRNYLHQNFGMQVNFSNNYNSYYTAYRHSDLLDAAPRSERAISCGKGEEKLLNASVFIMYANPVTPKKVLSKLWSSQFNLNNCLLKPEKDRTSIRNPVEVLTFSAFNTQLLNTIMSPFNPFPPVSANSHVSRFHSV